MISPSSLYNPMSVLLIILECWDRIRAPTNSHTSAPSKLPIVTSNRWLSFLIHGLPSWKRSDLRQCLMILISLCETGTCWAAKSRALSSVCSVMEG